MTKDEIDSLPAGEEINALVAKHIFGLETKVDEGDWIVQHPAGCWLPPKNYSGEHSWENMRLVVEAVRYIGDKEDGREIGINYINNQYNTFTGWCCDIGPANGLQSPISAYAETAPLAVCKAALYLVFGART